MMTQQLGFSILTAPLAAIDRRALSQAWYSALHLARERAPHALPQAPCKPVVCRTGAPALRTETNGCGPNVLRATPRHSASRAHLRAGEQERRAPRSRLATNIERCFLDPARRVHRATFSVEGSNARVHVALQTGAAGTRLVAVCPPSVQERVKRALDEARYVLAVRGIALDVDVHGESA